MEISLRKWDMSDRDVLVDIVNHTSRKYIPKVDKEYTKEDATRDIDFALNKGKGVFRAIEYNGKVVGSISIEKDKINLDGRIGYFLKSSYEGNGIMTMAVGLIVKEAFATLDIVRITAYVASPNIGSIKVLENNFFKKEGVLRKASLLENGFTDVAIYSLLKEGI